MANRTIHITDGIDMRTARWSLKNELEEYGKVETCYMGNRNQDDGDKPWVKFSTPEGAQKALQAMAENRVLVNGLVIKAEFKPEAAEKPAAKEAPRSERQDLDTSARDLAGVKPHPGRSRSKKRSRSARRSRSRGKGRKGGGRGPAPGGGRGARRDSRRRSPPRQGGRRKDSRKRSRGRKSRSRSRSRSRSTKKDHFKILGPMTPALKEQQDKIKEIEKKVRNAKDDADDAKRRLKTAEDRMNRYIDKETEPLKRKTDQYLEEQLEKIRKDKKGEKKSALAEIENQLQEDLAMDLRKAKKEFAAKIKEKGNEITKDAANTLEKALQDLRNLQEQKVKDAKTAAEEEAIPKDIRDAFKKADAELKEEEAKLLAGQTRLANISQTTVEAVVAEYEAREKRNSHVDSGHGRDGRDRATHRGSRREGRGRGDIDLREKRSHGARNGRRYEEEIEEEYEEYSYDAADV